MQVLMTWSCLPSACRFSDAILGHFFPEKYLLKIHRFIHGFVGNTKYISNLYLDTSVIFYDIIFYKNLLCTFEKGEHLFGTFWEWLIYPPKPFWPCNGKQTFFYLRLKKRCVSGSPTDPSLNPQDIFLTYKKKIKIE